MTSYCVDIGSRSRKVGRFIARVRSELLKAVEEERSASKLSQQEIAKRLAEKRAVINHQLSGTAPLTLRSVAELSWALGREISFELREPSRDAGQNCNMETTTVEWKKPTFVGMAEFSARPRDAAKEIE
jgi:ribosome-binding protein aMBF1 (putative translation factor)